MKKVKNRFKSYMDAKNPLFVRVTFADSFWDRMRVPVLFLPAPNSTKQKAFFNRWSCRMGRP